MRHGARLTQALCQGRRPRLAPSALPAIPTFCQAEDTADGDRSTGQPARPSARSSGSAPPSRATSPRAGGMENVCRCHGDSHAAWLLPTMSRPVRSIVPVVGSAPSSGRPGQVKEFQIGRASGISVVSRENARHVQAGRSDRAGHARRRGNTPRPARPDRPGKRGHDTGEPTGSSPSGVRATGLRDT